MRLLQLIVFIRLKSCVDTYAQGSLHVCGGVWIALVIKYVTKYLPHVRGGVCFH